MSKWLDFLKRKTKGFEDELAFKLVVEPGLDWLKKKVSGTVEKKVVRIEETEKYLDEHRGEVIGEATTLLPPFESRRLLNRALQRKSQKPRPYGDKRPYGRNAENEMWDSLAWMRKSIMDEPVGHTGFIPSPRERRETWRNTFIGIARMSPSEFDTVIAATNRDTAMQYALMVWDYIDKNWDKIDPAAEKLARRVQSHVDKLDHSTSIAVHPSRIFVIGFFIDPIGWVRNGLTS